MKSLVGLVLGCLIFGLAAANVIPPGGNKEKNPCHAEVGRLQSSAGGTPPGRFVPQCLASGWYNHQQNHGSTGYTWCVDPENGQEIAGTKVGPGAIVSCPKCLSDKSSRLPATRVPGHSVPQCDNTGNFVTKQFNPSTGYSWCVDRVSGTEIPDTKTPPGQQRQLPC